MNVMQAATAALRSCHAKLVLAYFWSSCRVSVCGEARAAWYPGPSRGAGRHLGGRELAYMVCAAMQQAGQLQLHFSEVLRLPWSYNWKTKEKDSSCTSGDTAAVAASPSEQILPHANGSSSCKTFHFDFGWTHHPGAAPIGCPCRRHELNRISGQCWEEGASRLRHALVLSTKLGNYAGPDVMKLSAAIRTRNRDVGPVHLA